MNSLEVAQQANAARIAARAAERRRLLGFCDPHRGQESRRRAIGRSLPWPSGPSARPSVFPGDPADAGRGRPARPPRRQRRRNPGRASGTDVKLQSDVHDLRRMRILLIHSGGASQRLPAYSSLGKIFAPLPLLRPDGQMPRSSIISTSRWPVFPSAWAGCSCWPGRILLFDHRHVSPPPTGITAISCASTPRWAASTAVRDRSQGPGHPHAAKGRIEAMAAAGATDAAGKVLIDTGLLFFDADRTALMADLAGCDNGRVSRAAACMSDMPFRSTCTRT